MTFVCLSFPPHTSRREKGKELRASPSAGSSSGGVLAQPAPNMFHEQRRADGLNSSLVVVRVIKQRTRQSKRRQRKGDGDRENPCSASTRARMTSGGREAAQPGLVVSEGSAVSSSLCAAGLSGQRGCVALTDARAPPVLQGDSPLTRVIFQKRGLRTK